MITSGMMRPFSCDFVESAYILNRSAGQPGMHIKLWNLIDQQAGGHQQAGGMPPERRQLSCSAS